MRPRRVAATVVGCLLIILAAAGCGEDAQRDADEDAAATAATITRYLQNDVATPGLPADQQLAKVRSWLADPSLDYNYTRAYSAPKVRILTTPDQRIDVVVYKYGRPVLLEGTESAWGFACRRYTVDATSQLKAESIACPNGLSRNPNR